MSDVAIRVENLSKRYRIGALRRRHDTLRDQLTDALLSPFRRLRSASQHSDPPTPERSDEHIWALKDVSFDVKRGEVIGIIGRNGAGKTTMLKILSRITEPTEGQAELRGRVASLLEVGTGFHSELTGRDNIYLSGAILGMMKREIDRKFDEIVEFSGVEKFIDTPFKHYSSGMKVRLGFAVAAHLEPDILLVDEVLAVGDLAFQRKCLGKMGDVAREGRTVLFVSHNMAQINRLCARAVLLQNGVVKGDGPASLIIDKYVQTSMGTLGNQSSGQLLSSKDGSVILESFGVFGAEAQERPQTGGPCHIELEFSFARPVRDPGVIVSIRTLQAVELIRLSTYPISGISTGKCSGRVRYTLRIEELLLTGGSYVLAVGLSIPKISYLIAITDVGTFEIMPTDYYSSGYSLANRVGFLAARHSWELQALE